MSHTQGKLKAQDSRIYFDGLAGGFDIRDCPAPEANARRLVACWNACEGLTTDEIESKKVPFSRLTDLLSQRYELLEALRLVMSCAGEIASAPDGLLEMALDDGDEETRKQANAFLVARAAINKAEGKS